jgi:hypothetical protein
MCETWSRSWAGSRPTSLNEGRGACCCRTRSKLRLRESVVVVNTECKLISCRQNPGILITNNRHRNFVSKIAMTVICSRASIGVLTDWNLNNIIPSSSFRRLRFIPPSSMFFIQKLCFLLSILLPFLGMTQHYTYLIGCY